MAKRAGRGQDPAGIEATKQGELAILCRACPQPGINLPLGWERAPEDVCWLYNLILAQDANFKIKGRLRSSDQKDPALGPGWATFVGNEGYQNHLSKFADQNEISHCVSFAALWAANTKGTKGLRASGVGSVSCARHEIFRPNGTGDLQKGERYSNMDYIFLSSIVATTLLMITVSYDIACQWSKHLLNRMKELPERLHIPHNLQFQYRVPKFHLPAHVEKCHAPFSFNYTKWVGRTDGEGVEHNWSSLNGTTRCVAVMGPGGRQDTLDDFCNYSNWRKTVGLGDSLLRKLTLAIPQAILHHRAFEAFTMSLREEHSDKLQEWEQQVQAWEVDPSKPCPYDLPQDEVTMADVKQQLAEEEHKRVEGGEKSAMELSPSQFIVEGLQIEEIQRSIRADATKPALTTIQATSIQIRRTTLLKRIHKFVEIQALYMPQVEGLPGAEHSRGPAINPEEINIYLPSSLPPAALDALSHLRRQLRARTVANKHRCKNVDSQRAFTRSRELRDQIEAKIKMHKTQYIAARSALLSLRGRGEWEAILQPLQPEDVRGLHERALTEEESAIYSQTHAAASQSLDGSENIPMVTLDSRLAVGEGRRTLSWIWYTVSEEELQGVGGVHGSKPSFNHIPSSRGNSFFQGIRVEWVKSRARSQRWQEELLLVEEEMRRALEFCWWKANWWLEHGGKRRTGNIHLDEGIMAYASQQASVERQRGMQWEQLWHAIRVQASIVTNRVLKCTDLTSPGRVSLPELIVELTLPEDRDEDFDEELEV